MSTIAINLHFNTDSLQAHLRDLQTVIGSNLSTIQMNMHTFTADWYQSIGHLNQTYFDLPVLVQLLQTAIDAGLTRIQMNMHTFTTNWYQSIDHLNQTHFDVPNLMKQLQDAIMASFAMILGAVKLFTIKWLSLGGVIGSIDFQLPSTEIGTLAQTTETTNDIFSTLIDTFLRLGSAWSHVFIRLRDDNIHMCPS